MNWFLQSVDRPHLKAKLFSTATLEGGTKGLSSKKRNGEFDKGDNSLFPTVSPLKHSLCCTSLYTQKVTEAVV